MSNNFTVDFVETFETAPGKWFWRAVSNNGKLVAIGGEPFYSEGNAKRAAADLFPAVTDFRKVEHEQRQDS